MMDLVQLERNPVPLIGRRAELDELERVLGGVRPGAVLLAGDAGVGKTRLLAEFRAGLVDGGTQVLIGHCVDFGDAAPPYLPFAELFSGATERPELAAVLSEHHPAVARLAFRRGDGPAIGRDDLVDDVHAALSRLGAAGPVVVIVEDAHWADRSTLDMLSLLFTRGFDMPVGVVVSYRTDDLHRRHPLRPVLAQWSRLPGVSRTTLAPLPDSDVAELVRSLHDAPMPASTVHGIVTRAEGNAFFAEELLGASADSGGLPADLAGLLLVRLDTLDEDSRAVVRAAAVSGRQVAHTLLTDVTDLADTALEVAVRTAVERHVLVPAADGYAFRHALLAESVYDDLLPGERIRLHGRYVAALVAAGSAADVVDLARHARAAHDRETAVRAGLRAATAALGLGGPDEAAQQYEHLVRLLAGDPALTPDVDRAAVTAGWVTALMTAGQSQRAIVVARGAVDDLAADASVEHRAIALSVLAQAALIEDSWLAGETVQQGLALIPVLQPSELPTRRLGEARARLLTAQARVSMGDRRFDEAMEAAGEALALAEHLGLSSISADASTTIARLKDHIGDPDSAAEGLAAVIESARRRNHLGAELRGHHHLGGVHLGLAQLDRAIEVYRTGAERAAELGRPWAPYGIDARVLAAIAAHTAGRWDLAVELVDLTGQNPPALAEADLGAAGLLVAAGRGEMAALGRLPFLQTFFTFNGMIAVNGAYAAIDLYGDAGNLAAAVDVHDEVVGLLSGMWGSMWFQGRIRLSALLIGQSATAAVTASRADRKRLLERATRLRDVAHRTMERSRAGDIPTGPESMAWASRVDAEFARLCWIAGIQAPEAATLAALWSRTTDAFVVAGNPFEQARSRARWAAVSSAAGASDLDAVMLPARSIAERLGAAPLLAELAVVSGPNRRAASVTPVRDALTPRETEILGLVAQGRTNGEIGKRLFITTKTVSVHVSNILAKLGAAGRTEAAAVGRDRGLL